MHVVKIRTWIINWPNLRSLFATFVAFAQYRILLILCHNSCYYISIFFWMMINSNCPLMYSILKNLISIYDFYSITINMFNCFSIFRKLNCPLLTIRNISLPLLHLWFFFFYQLPLILIPMPFFKFFIILF